MLDCKWPSWFFVLLLAIALLILMMCIDAARFDAIVDSDLPTWLKFMLL